jgi:hypothetical protein
VLRRREEVTGGWGILHNEELHNLYFSPNTSRVMKSKRMRWAGCVVHMGDMHIRKSSVGNLKGRHHLGV